jgi:nucleotide-binding universal stress UspA family protein
MFFPNALPRYWHLHEATMKKRWPVSLFRKTLVPVIEGFNYLPALTAAHAISGDGTILLAGIIPVPEGASLSMAASSARQMRKTLRDLTKENPAYRDAYVRVAYNPWAELNTVIAEERPSLLVLGWPEQFEALKIKPYDVIAHPPCNIAIIGGKVPKRPEKLLVLMRGGPNAELALRLSLSVSRTCKAKVTSLHVSAQDKDGSEDAPFRGLDRVLKNLPEVVRQDVNLADPMQALLSVSPGFDLIVMGASGATTRHQLISPIADRILNAAPTGVIVVKTKEPAPTNYMTEEAGHRAISVLVDKWFAENTYSAGEFNNLNHLVDLKREQNLTISLALPALNEEETVGTVIKTIKGILMDRVPLLDEIVLIDSNSSDHTREIAAGLGVPVYIHQEILPRYGARQGKGEALWKSLYLTHGDILLWIDTDIINIHPRFVYGLIGPLLLKPEIQLIKGFYRRPLKIGDKVQLEGGGRVTELTARPLLNLFYPELSGVVQPLAGEYGGRRSALEKLPFSSGYGVEIGLLIDSFEKFGLGAIAQVDLMERIHRNQPLEALSKMSFAIIQCVVHKLEKRYGRSMLEDVNRTMKLIRYEPGRFSLDVEEIAERERPCMVDLPEYQERDQAIKNADSSRSPSLR